MSLCSRDHYHTNRVEHSRRNQPISIPKSKPKSINSNIRNETGFRNSALIASTSGVKIRPSGVQISFAPSCCILWSSYRVVRAAMAKYPPALATTLLEAQLIVAKAAASMKQQKKTRLKSLRSPRRPLRENRTRRTRTPSPRLRREMERIYAFREYSSKSHTFSNTRV